MSNRLHSYAGDCHPPSPFFVCFHGTYHPTSCVFSCQSGGFCFSLSAPGPLLFTSCVISCHLAPSPISLLIPSYLPAVRSPTPRPPLICFLCLLIRLWGTSLISRVYSMQSVASVFFHLAQSFGSSSML